MRSLLVILLLFALFAQATEAAGMRFGTRPFQPKYFRYRRWDPTHDFYDDYEFTREVRRPFHPMAYRQRLQR
ncbi:Protein CBG11185 [Caenorhabditis briggsae]|uniref:Uncharacterized protein n=2 Tax=Caenorhabditis briggsae TaxID=6238 RepID=A0AAE9ITI4_CAEBR|nr:Protein CBG11185 [Caenorhabditis briggsae]ULU05045.1 hypothetical protein L3Y34_017645 [Caenorhabditis briggsae]UMM17020.1 hypothetical protein L5515_013781 [Caenorhabditis briggsae]CAP30380.1 Protein CBG11185 [Caenorhabditis briggsae]